MTRCQTRTLSLVMIFAALLFTSQAVIAETPPGEGKEATRVLGAMCVPNFYRVSDDLYRSAQFSCKGGVKSLKKIGIKTVISLRHWHDDPYLLLKQNDIQYHRIQMDPWHPNKNDVQSFLTTIANSPKPILVHCQHGADRTGFMVAIYRIVVEDWSKETAECELLNGGFNASRLFAWFSRRFIDRMDVDAFRKGTGLAQRDVQWHSLHSHQANPVPS